jgi:hypothetical protein
MRQLEDEISADYDEAILDASLPANRFYEGLGYQTMRHEHETVDNGTVMVYDIMRKRLSRK